MSKDSSIKVFAENVGDTNPRPVNNIPVWIENVSAIGGGGGGDIPSDVSGKWEDASDCVQTNSASWGQGGGDNNVFYIYPGITTQQEVSENSGKNMKLYMSASNTYLDYAGKFTYSTGAQYCFRSISGNPRTSTYVNQVGITVKPDSAGVVLPFYTQKDTLVTDGGTVANANWAQTAYYDVNSNSLTDTYYSIQNLSSFVQNNSANWGGGSGPTGNNPTILFESHSYNDGQGTSYLEYYMSNTGSNTEYISFIEENESNPSPINVNGIQYSYSQIYYPIWCVNIEIPSNYVLSYNQTFEGHNTNSAIIGSNSSISARCGGGGWFILGANAVNFNSINSNTETRIRDANGMTLTIITNGSFSATGSTAYSTDVNHVGGYPANTFISATLGGAGGSTVTSGDVLPPAPTGTGNTYALYWNDANGLFWDIR